MRQCYKGTRKYIDKGGKHALRKAEGQQKGSARNSKSLESDTTRCGMVFTSSLKELKTAGKAFRG